MVFGQPEIFDKFNENLPSGKRTWWDKVSPEFIGAVSGTGRPFYNRMITGALYKIPGLVENLDAGASVLQLASGGEHGLAKLAGQYPELALTRSKATPTRSRWQRARSPMRGTPIA